MKLKTLAISALLLPMILSASLFDAQSSFFPSSEVRGSNQVFDHANHRILKISDYGDILEMEDNSLWRVDPHNWNKVRSWRLNDPITISQNASWFGAAEYKIINLNDNSYVEVRGHKGPKKNGNFTRYIRSLNWDTYQITLNDNSSWQMSSWDFLWINREWALNDCIIIGVNSSWDNSTPAILINVNLNKFVRAKQL